jgi:AcrR family transcriptional regulator
MSVENQKRPYRMKKRAELEAETRLRITESAVALHGSVGPAQTSMSAIAEHAGVRRSTLYRHFPDEAAIVAACSAHWSAENPAPDLERWAAIEDPDERLAAALGELHPFYARNERMLLNLFRDEDTVPAIGASFARFHGYLDTARDVLTAGRPPNPRTRAAIGHAITFHAWRSLVREQGLSDDDAAEVLRRLVTAAGRD